MGMVRTMPLSTARIAADHMPCSGSRTIMPTDQSSAATTVSTPPRLRCGACCEAARQPNREERGFPDRPAQQRMLRGPSDAVTAQLAEEASARTVTLPRSLHRPRCTLAGPSRGTVENLGLQEHDDGRFICSRELAMPTHAAGALGDSDTSGTRQRNGTTSSNITGRVTESQE